MIFRVWCARAARRNAPSNRLLPAETTLVQIARPSGQPRAEHSFVADGQGHAITGGVASTQCRPITRTPGVMLIQVKERPESVRSRANTPVATLG